MSSSDFYRSLIHLVSQLSVKITQLSTLMSKKQMFYHDKSGNQVESHSGCGRMVLLLLRLLCEIRQDLHIG